MFKQCYSKSLKNIFEGGTKVSLRLQAGSFIKPKFFTFIFSDLNHRLTRKIFTVR